MALIQDPATGLYVDQATGRAFTDPGGTQLSTNPGLTAQAVRSLQISNQLYSKLGGFQQAYQQAQTGQTQLGTALDRTIAGTGPSVAQTQLQQTQEQIARQQQSDAAGATGQNAALARYAAMKNTEDAQARANQAGAAIRAQEVAQAEQAKAGVLANQAGEAAQFYGTTANAAGTASANAGSTQGAQSTIDEQNSQANKALAGNIIGGAGAAVTKAAVSDKREKKDVSPVADGDMRKLLDAIQGFTGKYKNPGTEGEAPGNRIFPMAQDIEKGGPVGESMVIQGKPLKLDVHNSLGAALAAVASLHKRLEEIEKKKAA